MPNAIALRTVGLGREFNCVDAVLSSFVALLEKLLELVVGCVELADLMDAGV
jgi:hypothetical protein